METQFPEFLKTSQVAKILKVSHGTIENLIKRGELPAHKIGKQFRVDKEQLYIYIKEASTVGETIEPGIISNSSKEIPSDEPEA